jgi:hypothetical protein
VIRDGAVEALRAALRRPDEAVAHLPAVPVDADTARRLVEGRTAPLAGGPGEPPGPCRLYHGERFLGLGERGPTGLRALRLLHADRPGPRPVPR